MSKELQAPLIKKTLETLIQDSINVTNAIIENDGEVDSHLDALLNISMAELAIKVDSCAHVLRRLQHEAEYFAKEEGRYKRIRQSLENAEKRFKDHVKILMRASECYELHGNKEVLKLIERKDTLVINEALLPDEYKKEAVTLVPDKELIERDLMKKVPIPGAKFEKSYALRPTLKKREIT